MNKFQKIAVQMAKDDIKKGSRSSFRRLKNDYYNLMKIKSEWPIQKVLDFKNWNKKASHYG